MFAHSCNFAGTRHDLVAHLRAVADTARVFSAHIEGGTLAYYAGLWHDLGKFHLGFQDYLRRCEADPDARERGPEHKGAGAVIAYEHCPPVSTVKPCPITISR